MKDLDIFQKIVDIVSFELNVYLDENVQITDLLRNHGVDSVVVMALIVYLESEFQIELDRIYEINQDELTFLSLIQLIKEQMITLQYN